MPPFAHLLSPTSVRHQSTNATTCSHVGRVEGHTLLPPRQYCSHFNASECARYWVPKGNCVWVKDACRTDPQCVHLATAPTGASYIFYKFHKVGSSTVASTLRLAARSKCPPWKGQSATIGSAPAHSLCLLRARPAALGGSALQGWPPATGIPATASAVRARQLQSR